MQTPPLQSMQTKTINRHMQLKRVRDPEDEEDITKPLVVILSWLMAKDNHIAKFRAIYSERGFDVLTVHLGPCDLLFPVTGSQVVAGHILDYLLLNPQYQTILVHAFSIGAYLMGEVFVKIRQDVEKYKDIAPRIKGFILDSGVDVEGIPLGLPRAVSQNPILVKVLEWYAATHLGLMYSVATRHYLRSSKNFHHTPLKCPALMFASDADAIGDPPSSELVADNWRARGCDVKLKCWKDSQHVGHLYKYPDEYAVEIDEFLSKIGLMPSKL